MKTLIVGNTGSGKTYLAVHDIVKLCKNNHKLKRIYTNIEGFNFDKINEIQKLNYKTLTVHPLDLDLLYHHMTVLYDMRIRQKLKDDDLIHYCQIYKIFDVEFFIDESHTFLEGQNKVKVWWFTYHRHFGQDYTLLTQNKDLIGNKYRKFPDRFILAKNSGLRFKKNILRYDEFSSFTMSAKSKPRSFSLTMNDEIFKLYKSGSVLDSPNYLLPMLASMFAFLFIAGFVIWWFMDSKQSAAEEYYNEHPSTVSSSTVSNQPLSNTVEISLKTQNYRVFCDSSFCHVYKGRSRAEYPYQYFIAVLGTIDADILYQRALYVYKGTTSDDVEMYVALADEDCLEYFPDFYWLRDSPVDPDAALSVVPEDISSQI